jgi:chaperone required for assembly of F1-ATPase
MLTKGKPQPPERPKRFYTSAEAVEAGDSFGVALDGRMLRTPQGNPMRLPTKAAAGLIAAEWAAQGEHIVVADMPATRLAFTAIDRVGGAREEVAAEVARYAGSDLLCYFADGPAELVARQRARWSPLLEWGEAEMGLRFAPCAGIVHEAQPPETLDAVDALALRLDDYALTGLAHGAALFGSALLALALERGRLDGAEAFAASRLDEAFQEEHWGQDAEAAGRTARMQAEAATLGRWFAALKA